ncbi:MAG TPA: ABC transporter permease [Nocardioides sp.]|uniref:ABC transporter permease n=1 Tax=Nocardioides sp. TaxID=35761 RepID=UPI002F3EBDE6
MTRFWWLLATCLRGLRARWVLSLGSLLLTAIAIASAVVGPSYQQNAANSFVISQLRAQPPINTGLTYDYRPQAGEDVDRAISTARDETGRESGSGYLSGRPFVWQPLHQVSLPGGIAPAVPRLVSVTGACDHVQLEGRCPTNPGEIAILRADAATYGVKVGDPFNPYGEVTPFTVVGLYRPTDSNADIDFWGGSQVLQSSPGALLPRFVPAHPAPWITSQAGIELGPEPWYVGVNQPLATPPSLTVDDLDTIATRVKALAKADEHGTLLQGLSLEAGNTLPVTAAQLIDRRGVSRSTVEPAVLSLILVALVLLSRLLSAAMILRRGELALASLRGYGRRQLWFLGMLEPLVILAVATPLGLLLGYLASRALAQRWLVPHLPVPFIAASGLAALGVVVVTAVVAAVVVRDAVGEPLSAQIAGVRRPTKAGRLLVIVRLALVALAAAALITAASRSHPAKPDATDLFLPILLAVASGLLVGLLVLGVAGAWVRWSRRRRAISSYVASRTVRRRREGTMVILPVTAALTVAVFAVGVSLAASTWRASAAATEVGAPLSFETKLPLTRAVGLTHELDPQGRWLMAAAEDFPNADEVESVPQPRVVVDATRLARVASWPAQWTPGRSAADVAREIGPRRPPVMMRGSTLSMTIDNHVDGDYRQLGVIVTVLDDSGDLRNIPVGPFRQGRSTQTRKLPTCHTGCQVETISFGGPSALVEAMRGTATIESATVDGGRIPGMLDRSWRTQAPQIINTATAVRKVELRNGRLTLSFRSRSSESYAGISPADFPPVVPVLFGRLTSEPSRLPTGASGLFRVAPAGAPAESMPFRGPSGTLIDFTAFIRSASQVNSDTLVYIWARADTPRRVLSALSDHGLSNPTRETETKHVLDQDAFALALRLYVVVTALVILLAVAGLGANLAVQLPARRRDAASLRVVGVKRRSVMVGVVAEFVVVLGAAAVAGVAAGGLAQYVVVRTVTLGFVDSSLVPRVVPSFDVGSAVTLSALVLVGLVVAASGFALLTVRGARTSSLRENAR